jgi:hypothetical protein
MTVHRINHDKIPKVREYAEITLSDGTVMTGFVFVEATSRILDLLNQDPPFFPLIDKEERIHLVNKHMIVHVRPFDQ